MRGGARGVWEGGLGLLRTWQVALPNDTKLLPLNGGRDAPARAGACSLRRLISLPSAGNEEQSKAIRAWLADAAAPSRDSCKAWISDSLSVENGGGDVLREPCAKARDRGLQPADEMPGICASGKGQKVC
jgi:hypothetical protein